MAAIRTAHATWNAGLIEGNGAVSATSSKVFTELPVTWAARTDQPGGKTSPEELIAAAHAACYSMAFSAGLGKAGHPPTKLDVDCTVTFENVDGGWKVASSALKVVGQVPGIDAAAFQAAAEAAKDGCPVSGALKGNVELSVEATLL